MPRRADWLFGLTVVAAVSLETYALVAIVAASFGPTRALVHGSTIAAAVVRGLELTALNAIAVTLIILLLHVVTSARRERHGLATRRWVEELAPDVLGISAELPRVPPSAALEALLQLRDTVSGAPGVAAAALLRSCLPPRSKALGILPRSRFGLLDMFETLARARLPESLPIVYRHLTHRDPAIRFAAARAAARIADEAAMPGLSRQLAALTFGPRAWLEILLLLRAPEDLVDVLLAAGDQAARWAAVETVGRRYLLCFAEDVVSLLPADDPELVAAALRALAKLRYPPTGSEALVLGASRSDVDFVRLQAVRVLPLIDDERVAATLWERLGDPSFYVRQAAARALETADAGLLRRASQDHPDRFGRAMARQELPVPHAA